MSIGSKSVAAPSSFAFAVVASGSRDRGSQILLDDPAGNPIELFQPAH
jgi:hypothetical protein